MATVQPSESVSYLLILLAKDPAAIINNCRRLLTAIVTPWGIHYRQSGSAWPVVGYEFEFPLDMRLFDSAGLRESPTAPFLDSLGES